MQLLSCARAWERLGELLNELLLVCEVSKVRTAPPPALTQHVTGSLIACLRAPACLQQPPGHSGTPPQCHTLTPSHEQQLSVKLFTRGLCTMKVVGCR